MKQHVEYRTGEQKAIRHPETCALCGWRAAAGTDDVKWAHRVNGTQCYAKRLENVWKVFERLSAHE